MYLIDIYYQINIIWLPAFTQAFIVSFCHKRINLLYVLLYYLLQTRKYKQHIVVPRTCLKSNKHVDEQMNM